MPPSIDPERQIQLDKQGNNVYILSLTGNPHKANVFSAPLVRRLDECLDIVESNLPCALIIRGNGKFFSAGFDLEALTGASHKKAKKTTTSSSQQTQKNRGNELVEQTWKVLARLLTFAAPTIALMNGHAFGLGLFLGLTCDHRIMIQYYGDDSDDAAANKRNMAAKVCLPEITIGLPLGSGFAALAKSKLTRNTLRTAALTGKQFNSQEALEAGIIDSIVRQRHLNQGVPKEVLQLAEKLVATSEKKGILSSIKMELYGDAYAALMTGKNRAKL